MDVLTRPGRIVGALVVALLVAACSSQGGGASTAPTTAAQPSAATAGSGSVYTVSVAQGAMGAYITGEDGKTLYLLTKDSAGTSTCTDQCASAWPPFTLDTGETVVAGSGVTGSLGTIKRPDGSIQVAINGIPLYYFSGDSASGQTNGQGFKGIWYVVSPSGTAVGAGAASPSASPSSTKSSGGGGYGY